MTLKVLEVVVMIIIATLQDKQSEQKAQGFALYPNTVFAFPLLNHKPKKQQPTGQSAT